MNNFVFNFLKQYYVEILLVNDLCINIFNIEYLPLPQLPCRRNPRNPSQLIITNHNDQPDNNQSCQNINRDSWIDSYLIGAEPLFR